MSGQRRRITYITGTRAEFGLMRSTLAAIREHPKLELRLIATGMHLDRRHGDGLRAMREAGFRADAIVAWQPADSDSSTLATETGEGMSGIADVLAEFKTDVVLVVGDRVEAFAGAAAGFIGGYIVAHVHGGDRAAGQVDDSLRHAISKIAHVHFPATALSRKRLIRMGEDQWRIHMCGAPGIDGIVEAASDRVGLVPRSFALVVQHPVESNEARERKRMDEILKTVARFIPSVAVIYPNNDPGSVGIRAA
ncbi:MAG: UDP-N-acetylglucosamine 2-epimerase, partial [Phycisphaerae bacterium]|nr:UDP-N-acetylglucosamine 2-epimerase [Phycisphaerae bacterium]